MKQNFALFAVIYCLKLFSSSNEESLPSLHHSPTLISNNRSFVIDFKNDIFLKDGKPFHYISGSFHYFRVPRAYWRDRLQKIRIAGLNAVSTYVEWSLHEPSPGNYRFEDSYDIEYFLQLVAEEGLLVILRAGPYICAERDFGGLPPWLLTLYPDIIVRSKNVDYMNEVKKWFRELFGRLEKHLYGNGGPIILVQAENEYGSYPTCDMDYRLFLKDELMKYVQKAAVLFTTDGAGYEPYLKCGHIPGVYATVDFGPGTNVTKAFSEMRKASPRGPLVNSEFYAGWFSNWEKPRNYIDTSTLIKTMTELLDMKANINIYMFCGGTNFGFTNAAGFNGEHYEAVVTSYDYDAPLNEAGDCTPKYHAIRNLISKYHKLPNIPIPRPTPKGKYGKVRLEAILSIFNSTNIKDKIILTSREPRTFDQMNLTYGYMMYETIIPDDILDPASLFVPDFNDRAVICVDHVPVAILPRTKYNYSLPLPITSGQTLSILIENEGRVNFGWYMMKDRKGLLSSPLLDGKILLNWTMTGLPFRNTSWVQELSISTSDTIKPPALYVGELVLPSSGKPLDTFINMSGWGKGIIFINEFNLGRYWPSIGPQVTLYVPGCYLRPSPQKNKILLFETEHESKSKEIEFLDIAILDKIPPTTMQTERMAKVISIRTNPYLCLKLEFHLINHFILVICLFVVSLIIIIITLYKIVMYRLKRSENLITNTTK